MKSTIEISRDNAIAAYKTAKEAGADSTCKVLEALFGAETFKPKDVMERIKTFEDAMMELGEEHPLVKEWRLGDNLSPDLEAYLRLRIIVAALNEGWEPQFTEDEVMRYPWFWLYTQEEIDEMGKQSEKERNMVDTSQYRTEYAGLASAHSHNAPSNSTTTVGSRLCLKSDALATYCGRQFTDIWADFLLIRK